MKLLLTSSGLTNPSILKALFELVEKKPEDTSVVFIPTAANVEEGDMSWFEDDLANLHNQNFKSVDSADISVLTQEQWLPLFQKADVLYFEGGDTYHLMKWIHKSGLKDLLPELLKTKVWVGVSAGSMVLCKDLVLNISQTIYEEDLDETENMSGLDFVDFYFLPHLNSQFFTKVRKENVENVIKGMKEKIYCMDDDGAIMVTEGRVEIVSEGEYLEFN